MSKKRKQSSPEFKAKVASASLLSRETVAEPAAGFGIHPTMINNVAQQHGGTIKVESKAGKGSRFIVTLRRSGLLTI